MGDNFLRQQVANFRKGRDLALIEVSQPGLFERPEDEVIIYIAKPETGERFQEGETLLAIPDGGQVSLTRGHRKIGFIDGDGGKHLASLLEDPRSPGAATVRVLSVSQVSGLAHIELIRSD